MTEAAVGLALGLGLAWGGVALARRGRQEHRAYAVGLIVAALVYVGFAVAGDASTLWLGVEGLGVFGYGAFAVAGWRGSVRAVAVGWALHPLWDVGLHLAGAGHAFVPAWYAWLCLSFDLVLAVAAWRRGGAESSDGGAG